MIVIYTKSDCIYCTRAKNLMKSRDIPFQEQQLDVETVKELFPHARSFPIIVKDGVLIGGYLELVEHVAQDPNFGKLLLNEG